MKNIYTLIIMGVLLLAISFVQAQNIFTVTNTNDPEPFIYDKNPDDPAIVGSLQWAIRKANDATGLSVLS